MCRCEAVAPATGANPEVEQSFDAAIRPDLAHDLLHIAAVQPAVGIVDMCMDRCCDDIVLERIEFTRAGNASAADRECGAKHRAPLVRSINQREHRRRIARDVAPAHRAEEVVVVAILERRSAWQYHVGIAGGFVMVDVDRDAELERGDRARQTVAVRVAHHRVAGDGHQCADLARARRFHFFGHAGDGHLPEYFRVARYPRAPSCVLQRASTCIVRCHGRR